MLLAVLSPPKPKARHVVCGLSSALPQKTGRSCCVSLWIIVISIGSIDNSFTFDNLTRTSGVDAESAGYRRADGKDNHLAVCYAQ
jgi:hypothetical protein